MIPVPGFPKCSFRTRTCSLTKRCNEQEIFIPELRKKFSVKELLDGIEDLSVRMERRENEFEWQKVYRNAGQEFKQNGKCEFSASWLRHLADVQPERDVLPIRH